MTKRIFARGVFYSIGMLLLLLLFFGLGRSLYEIGWFGALILPIGMAVVFVFCIILGKLIDWAEF